ncbi:hypothetical protein B0H14DRAFT_3691516 [Mycena olivaceomarginata]|nr:hypothetical protein B0H14DRAFT_3691516 [Mycena olivaceomarginata]
MAAMHGNNGLLQVIATLFWWGSRVEGRRRPRDPEEWKDFIEAVDDITWVLDQLLESGDIGRYKEDSPQSKAVHKTPATRRRLAERKRSAAGERWAPTWTVLVEGGSKERGGQGSEEAEDELPRPNEKAPKRCYAWGGRGAGPAETGPNRDNKGCIGYSGVRATSVLDREKDERGRRPRKRGLSRGLGTEEELGVSNREKEF